MELDNNNLPIDESKFASNLGKAFKDGKVHISNQVQSNLVEPTFNKEFGKSQYDTSDLPLELAQSPEHLQNLRANRQSNIDAWGNGLARFAAGTALKTGQSLAHLAALPSLDMETIVNNDLVKFFDEKSEELRQATPVYQTTAQEQAGPLSWDNLTSANFWAGDIVGEGGSFLASAWLTGAGMGKILDMGSKAIGAKLIAEAAGDINGARSLWQKGVDLGLAKLPKITAATVAAYTEGAFEAREVYKDLVSKTDPEGKPLYTHEQALNGAQKTLLLNMLTVPLMEYQFSGIFKSPNASRNAVKNLFAQTESGLGANLAYATKDFFSSGAKEGLQEGLQTAISHVATSNAGKDTNFLQDTVGVMGEFLSNFTTPEYVESMLQGFIIGSPMGTLAGKAERKQEANKLDNIRAAYKDHVGDMLGEDIYKKKEDGSYELDKGQKILKEATEFYRLEHLKNVAAAKGDLQTYNALRDFQFANMAYAKFQAGLGERFLDEIEMQGQKSPEEWGNQGVLEFERDEFGNKLTPKQISEKYKKKALELEDLYNTIQDRFKDVAVGDNHMEGIWKEAVYQKFIKDDLKRLEREKAKTVTASGDIVTSQINNEVYELKHLHKLMNIAEKNEAPESYSSIQKLIKEKEAKVKKLKTDNKLILEGLGIESDLDPYTLVSKVDPIDDIKFQEIAAETANAEAALEESRKRFDELTNPNKIKAAIKEQEVKKKEQEETEKEAAKEDKKKKDEEAKTKAREEANIPVEPVITTEPTEPVTTSTTVNPFEGAGDELTEEEIIAAEEAARKAKESTEKTVTHSEITDRPIDEIYTGLTASEKAALEEYIKESIATPSTSTPGATSTPQGHVHMLGDLIVNAATSLAYLTKEYVYTLKGNNLGKETISNELQDNLNKNILSQRMKIGDKLTISIDKTFNVVTATGTVTYNDLLEREVTEGKTNLLIPIKVEWNGETIGYIHDIDWINPTNVASKNDNINAQRELLKAIRNYIALKESIETTINSKTYGKLNKNVTNEQRSVTEAFPDPSIKFAIGKSGQFFNTVDNPVDMGTDKRLINKTESILNGVPYAIVPTPVKGDYIAVPVETVRLKEEYLDSIMSAIDIYLANAGENVAAVDSTIATQILNQTGIDIRTTNGLRTYVTQFIYTHNLNESEVNRIRTSKADGKKYIDIKPEGIYFMESGGKQYSITSPETLANFSSKLRSYLRGMFMDISLPNLESNKAYQLPIITKEGVQYKSYNTYADYIKDHTTTNLNSNKISETEWSYFDQPTIGIATPFLREEVVTPKAEETTTPTTPTEEVKVESTKTRRAIPGLGGKKAPKASITENQGDPALAISKLQLEEITNELRDILVPGFTSYKQNAIVNSMLSGILSIVKDNPGITRNKAYEEFKDILTDYEDQPEFKEVLDNFDEFQKHAETKLKQLGIITEKGNWAEGTISQVDMPDADFEVETTLVESNFDDSASFMIDTKESVSARVKTFLAFVRDVELDPTSEEGVAPKKNHLGLDTYLSIDTVYNTMSGFLADIEPSWQSMRDVLENKDIQRAHPWIKEVLNQIDNYDGDIERLKNELVVAFSKSYANFKMVLWTTGIVKQFNPATSRYEAARDVNGKPLLDYSVKVIDVNRNSVEKVIIKQWFNNLRTTNLVEISKVNPGELVLSKTAIESLKADYEKLAKNPTIEATKAWLARFGVDVSTETLESIKEAASNSKSKKLKWEQHFTDNSGIFKVMADKLKENTTEEEGMEDILSLNNPLRDNSGIRALAKAEAEHTEMVYSNSHKNGEGNTVYSYALNKALTHRYRRLMDNPSHENSEVNKLRRISFNSTSSWLDELAKPNSKMARVFNIAPFDTIRKGKSSQLGVKLTKQSDREQEIVRLAAFQNQGNSLGSLRDKEFISNFVWTVPGKTTSYMITALKHQTSIDLKQDGTFSINKPTLDALYKIAEAEILRIQRFNKLKAEGKTPDIDAYTQGADKFFMFDFLNDLDEIWDGKTVRPMNAPTNDGRTVNDLIMDEIHSQTIKMINVKLDEWKKLGLVETTKEGRTKLHFLDRSYLKQVAEPSLRKGATNKEVSIYAAADYEINSLIANSNIMQTFVGDPALFFKRTDKGISFVDNTWDNVGKRLAKDIAPGIDIPESKYNKYKQVFLKDWKGLSENYEQLEKVLGKKNAEEYRKIESTDAQEFTTAKEHLYLMKMLGKIGTEDYKTILGRIENGEDLSDDELKIIMQPMKPVYVEQEIDEANDISRVIYIKSSSFPLIPQLTKGLEIDKLRVAMETQGISRAAFKTATKVGGAKFVDIWEYTPDGELTNRIDASKLTFEKSHIVIPRTGFRIQQEVPYDPEKEEITKGSQESKLTMANILNIEGFKLGEREDIKGTELRDIYNELHNKLYLKGLQSLQEDVTTDGVVDIKKVRDLLVAEATNRGYPINDIQGLKLVNEDEVNAAFKMPLWALPSANKFESLLNSIVTNRVNKQKLRGFSGVLGTEEGFRGVKETDEAISETSGIIFSADFDPKQGLKPQRIENGVVKPAQILAPCKFRDNKGKLINAKDLEKDGKIDHTKLPKELLLSMGFRIPTQGHNSESLMEIVGFLPKEMGDLVIAPRDFTKQMGSDFDIDKLYAYIYNTKYTKGILSKVESDSTIEGIQNAILDVHFSVLSHPEVFPFIMEPLTTGNLQNIGNDIQAARERRGLAGTKVARISDMYWKKKYLDSVAGKAGVGVKSLDSTFNASVQGLDIEFAEKDLEGEWTPINLVFGNKNGKGIYTSSISNEKAIDGGYKTQTISAYQSAAVDNEKDPILGKINSNAFTFDAERAFAAVGFTENFIPYLTAQDVIFEYADALAKAGDSTVSEFTANVKDKVVAELEEKYAKIAGIDLKETKISPNYPLTKEEMWEAIVWIEDKETKTLTPPKDYALTQLRALAKFVKARDLGEQLANVQSAINSDSKGVGVNMFEPVYKMKQVHRLISNDKIKNVDKLIGKYETDEFGTIKSITPATINGFATMYGTNTAVEYWSRFFPYNSRGIQSVFNEIQEVTGARNLTASNQKEIWEEIKAFVFTNSKLGISDNNTHAERMRLFFGKNSLAYRIEALKKTEKGKQNDLIARLSTEINPTGEKPSYVEYNASAGENLDELNVYRGFVDLLIDEETREIAQDLVTYAYLNGGTQGATDFLKYVPISYLNSIGFADKLRTIDFNNEEVLGSYDSKKIGDLSTFVLQYFQHNPEKAPKIEVSQEGLTVISTDAKDKNHITKFKLPDTDPDKKNPAQNLVVERFSDELQQFVITYPEVLAIYEPKTPRRYRLYKHNGDNTYSQIDTLGDNLYVEYNADVQYTRSTVTANQSPVTPSTTNDISTISSQQGGKTIPNPVPTEEVTKKYAKPLVDVINIIAHESSSSLHKAVATMLNKNSDFLKGIKYVITSNIKSRGTYTNGTVSINPSRFDKLGSELEFEEILLHEVLHAFTSERANLFIDGKLDELTKQEVQLFKSLDKIRELMISNLSEIGKKGFEAFQAKLAKHGKGEKVTFSQVERDAYNSLSNVKEFITGVMTRPEVQEKLKSIPYQVDRTMWDRFVELITKFLNYVTGNSARDTALEQAVGDIITLTQTAKSNITTNPTTNPSKFTNHSGGAEGGDKAWDSIGREFGVINHNHYTVAYFDKLSKEKQYELDSQYRAAAKFLKRGIIAEATYAGRLVRRDMIQANNSDAIFGITELVKPGVVGRKGYINKSTYSIPEGGTGYAVARGIILNKPTYVFNQSNAYGNEIGWYKWDIFTNDFVKVETPTLTENFAGIGSQAINQAGIEAIREVYNKTFSSSTGTQETLDPINIWGGTNENAILSNLATRPFTIGGDTFDSVEQYFQYQKFNYVREDITKEEFEHNQKIADAIMNSKNGFQIKQLGRQFKALDSKRWDVAATSEMKNAIRASFEQNPDALKALLATGNRPLTHTQDKGRWATDFPRILMEVREELRGTNIDEAKAAKTPLDHLKEEIKLNTKQQSGKQKAMRLKALKAYNTKYGTSHSIQFTQVGQSDNYTWEVSERWNGFDPYQGKIDYALAATPYTEYNTIIKGLQAKIDVLNKNIAKFKEDTDRVAKLEATKRDIENKIENIVTEANLASVIEVGEQEMATIANMFKQPKLDIYELDYILRTTSLWEKGVDVLFDEIDIEPDSDGKLSPNVQKVKDIASLASLNKKRWKSLAESALLEAMKKETGLDLIKEDVLGPMKEIGSIASNVMDISRSGNTVLSVMDMWMRGAAADTNVEANELFDKIDALTEKLNKSLLFKKLGYDIFAQKKDGKKTGNIVDRYSQDYYDERAKQLFFAKKGGNEKSWKKYFKWKTDNHVTLDIRKLVLDLYTKEDGTPVFTEQDRTKYIADLEKTFGVERAKELIEKAEDKAAEYKLRLQAEEDRVNALDEPESVKQLILSEWKALESPVAYLNQILDNTVTKVGGKYGKNTGWRYIVEVPTTTWNDSSYDKIMSDSALREYYEFMITTLNQMYTVLPEDMTDELQYNSLPSIQKDILELFGEKGMRAGFVGLEDKFKELVTTRNLSTRIKEDLDPITNKPIPSLRVSMLDTNLSAEDKSYDLGKVLKAFGLMTLTYKHKSKVEDQIRLAQTIMNDAMERQLSPTGVDRTDKFGDKAPTKESLKNLKAQMEYAIEAWYGNRKAVEGVTGKKLLTSRDKARITELEDKIARIQDNESFTDEEKATKIENINKEIDSIGGYVAGSAIGDFVLQYVQLKGMGWNIFGATTNVIFGWLSNLVHANGREDFSIKEFFKANSIMLNSISSDIHRNKQSKKILALMKKLDVVKELNEIAYEGTTSTNRAAKGIKKVSPFELYKRGEYFIQGQTMVATMLGTKINGKSLWDLYDENGNLPSDIEPKVQKQLKFKLDQIVKSIHGNYDPNSPVKIKKTVGGRLLMQFRSWMAEGFANRFEDEKHDTLLQRQRKGRYRTLYELGFTKSLKTLLKQITYKKDAFEGMSEVDKANMRKNLAELNLYIALFSMALILKRLVDDDDDTIYLTNFLLNQGNRLQADISFYVSPMSFEKISRSTIPAFELATSGSKWMTAVYKAISGEDELQSGPYKGNSRLTRETIKLFPLGNQGYRQYDSVTRSE